MVRISIDVTTKRASLLIFVQETSSHANHDPIEYYRGKFNTAFASNSLQYNGSAIVGKHESREAHVCSNEGKRMCGNCIRSSVRCSGSNGVDGL